MKKKTFAVLAMAFLLAGMGLMAQAKSKAKGDLTGQVNVNEATIDQLTLLPGVGLEKAKRIQEYVKAHPFKSVDEMVEVKGIGPKQMEKLRPFVSVSGPTTAKWAKAVPLPKPAS